MKQSKGESGMEKTKEEKKGLFFRFINGVEVIGNKLHIHFICLRS